MLFPEFYFSKTILGKGFSITFVLFCFSSALFSQGITPQQQGKIDSLLTYIGLRQMEGEIPDQKYIDSVNLVIRNMDPSQKVNDFVGKAIVDSTKKEIRKQSIAGSSFTVPAGKTWRVKRVYVNDGGSANVLVTSVKFDKLFIPGEKIYAPTWLAEAELLNEDSAGFSCIFFIEESELP